MEKPLFYIGSSYLWTLMLLALACSTGGTGSWLAGGLMGLAGTTLMGETVRWMVHRRRGERSEAGIVPAVCVAVLVACSLFLLKTCREYQPALELAGEEAHVEGVVTRVQGDSESGAHRCVIRITNPADGLKEGQLIRLSSSQYEPNVNDVLSFEGTLYQLGEADLDIQNYYKSVELYLGTYTYHSINVTCLEEADLPSWYHDWRLLMGKIATFRTYLTGNIGDWLPDSEAGVLTGMVLGDKSGMTEDQKEQFKIAGILHLFAVSGFHTSLWSMLIYRGLLKSGLGRNVASAGGMLFTLFFVALTGFSMSGLRAGFMLLLFFLSRVVVKQADSLNSLGLAALLITLGNPFSGGDSGILLSYFATLGILVAFPVIRKPVRAQLKQQVGNFKLRKRLEGVTDVIGISLSTFVFTLPYVMLSFGGVSLAAPLTNLLVTTVSSTAILLGGLGALFAGIPLLSLMTPWCFLLSGEVVRYMDALCQSISQWKFSYLGIDDAYFQVAVSACLILVAVCLVLKQGAGRSGEEPKKLTRLTGAFCCLILFSAVACHLLIK